MNENSGGGAAAGLIILVELALVVVLVVSMWRIFEKAGKPGWAAIIPIYNIIVMLEIVGMPMWWIILFIIPLANIVASVMLAINMAKSFGKDATFGVLALFCCSIVGYPMLAFGDAQYQGPSGG